MIDRLEKVSVAEFGLAPAKLYFFSRVLETEKHAKSVIMTMAMIDPRFYIGSMRTLH